MAIASHNSEFIRDLMKVLELDPSTTRAFTLRAAVNDVVTLDVLQFAQPGTGVTEWKRYQLTFEELKDEA